MSKRGRNIFEIVDNILIELHRTKKMFLIMLLSIMILPPAIMIVVVSTSDERPLPPHVLERENLIEKLRNGEITQNEFLEKVENIHEKRKEKPIFGGNPIKHMPQIVVLIVSVFWLGFGIRQWLVLNNWSKRYDQFKEKMDEVDKKLDDSESTSN